jgi:hypothetical protein
MPPSGGSSRTASTTRRPSTRTNLYFAKDDAQGKGGVDVRHFVVSPALQGGTFTTDTLQTGKSYCNWTRTLFDGFAGNDRQTVLNDDDGSLTGYTRSISVNLDDFFLAPVQAIECRSDETATGESVRLRDDRPVPQVRHR